MDVGYIMECVGWVAYAWFVSSNWGQLKMLRATWWLGDSRPGQWWLRKLKERRGRVQAK